MNIVKTFVTVPAWFTLNAVHVSAVVIFIHSWPANGNRDKDVALRTVGPTRETVSDEFIQ